MKIHELNDYRLTPSAKELVSMAQKMRVDGDDYAVPDGYLLECLTSAELPVGRVDWMLASIYASLGSMYEKSGMGWKSEEKRGELLDARQRFLFLSLSSESSTPVAFVSYMYDLEDSNAVLYVYELFVEESKRRKGLAVILMNIAERLARRANMEKIMLTMFTANTGATHLYLHKLKYEIDPTSPSCFREPNQPDLEGYEILCKHLTRPHRR